jgi:hypothetical protein
MAYGVWQRRQELMAGGVTSPNIDYTLSAIGHKLFDALFVP